MKGHNLNDLQIFPERRKRLGQYFSGIGLARFLAALAGAKKANTIIDPMAGSGDMLAGCMSLGARPEDLAGIELDDAVAKLCARRFPEATCIQANAFSKAAISLLPRTEWDLVITNPPYVRYQSMANAASGKKGLPTAVQIRTGLIESLDLMTALDSVDRALFKKIASSYSGLSDLAVPSWILCAALTSVGGRIALVVPEAWLTRDYSAVVRYLLLRWFDVEYIVEDEHAVWFPDAQVKTNLVIAKRTKRKDSAFSPGDSDRYLKVKMRGASYRDGSPVGFDRSDNSEEDFASYIRTYSNANEREKNRHFEVESVSLASLSMNLRATTNKQQWVSLLEPHKVTSNAPYVPQCLSDWLRAGRSGTSNLITLEDMGISLGQGLRTGANAFFYATIVKREDKEAELISDCAPEISVLRAPLACLKPVLRKQNELPVGYLLRSKSLRGRTLDLRKLALPEDLKSGGASARAHYAEMPRNLAKFVRAVGSANFGTSASPRSISQFSAVAPNIRKRSTDGIRPPKYWYMLPDFADRHAPDLFIPRVNHGSPKTRINVDRALIDANFATINVCGDHSISAFAVCALMNSSWFRAALELSGSVMGGGALKIEAAHLRRVPVPKMSADDIEILSKLGEKLVYDEGRIEEIDQFVASKLLGRKALKVESNQLAKILAQGIERREMHRS